MITGRNSEKPHDRQTKTKGNTGTFVHKEAQVKKHQVKSNQGRADEHCGGKELQHATIQIFHQIALCSYRPSLLILLSNEFRRQSLDRKGDRG